MTTRIFGAGWNSRRYFLRVLTVVVFLACIIQIGRITLRPSIADRSRTVSIISKDREYQVPLNASLPLDSILGSELFLNLRRQQLQAASDLLSISGEGTSSLLAHTVPTLRWQEVVGNDPQAPSKSIQFGAALANPLFLLYPETADIQFTVSSLVISSKTNSITANFLVPPTIASSFTKNQI